MNLSEQNYQIEIESDPRNLITVEEFINYVCREFNIDEGKMAGIMLAVTEATTNAIIHANKNVKLRLVKIDAEMENKTLIIKVKDEGKGFDPSKVPDPTEPENLLKDSGRGLYLMKTYMDDIKFNVTPTGTETILTLKL
ncbi:MAG: ATP-binding protein [Ignavibacteriaceae bacterium]